MMKRNTEIEENPIIKLLVKKANTYNNKGLQKSVALCYYFFSA